MSSFQNLRQSTAVIYFTGFCRSCAWGEEIGPSRWNSEADPGIDVRSITFIFSSTLRVRLFGNCNILWKKISIISQSKFLKILNSGYSTSMYNWMQSRRMWDIIYMCGEHALGHSVRSHSWKIIILWIIHKLLMTNIWVAILGDDFSW